MGLDASLVAAATLRTARGAAPGPQDDAEATYQLQLAHVLLDGGYDGVATLGEALAAGDHGLGTVDRLDGELVVVDGEPWRVDWQGTAEVMAPETLTPFVVVSTMEQPRTARLRDASRDDVVAAVEELVHDAGAVVAVRLEGAFTHALVRSVPPQDPPYRPYLEVCATDEVRWEHRPFDGVFVGFRFPDLRAGSTIPGLHLHGLDHERTTGGHNHDLQVADAVLSVSISRDVVIHLPDRTMADLLETPPAIRAVQRHLLRAGPRTIDEISASLGIAPQVATDRVEWLADRGYVRELVGGVGGLGGQSRWQTALRAHAPRAAGSRMDTLLAALQEGPRP